MVSEATGYPSDMLDPELDMEADLGIDTVKQAEVFGAIREVLRHRARRPAQLRDYPTLASRGRLRARPRRGSGRSDRQTERRCSWSRRRAHRDPPSPSSGPAGADDVTERVLAMVSEATGYPVDMLDPELDMEADLGIDTVKQAEVFGAIREAFGIERDDQLKLRDYPTLAHVVGFVRERAGGPTRPLPTWAKLQAPSARRGTATRTRRTRAARGSIEAANAIPRRVPSRSCDPTSDRASPPASSSAPAAGWSWPGPRGTGTALGAFLEDLEVTVVHLDAALDVGPSRRRSPVRRGGPVHGVYWLPGLDRSPRPPPTSTPSGQRPPHACVDAARDDAGSLAGRPVTHRFLMAATRLGGLHGYDGDGATAPMGGAVTRLHEGLQPREARRARQGGRQRPLEDDAPQWRRRLLDETLRDPGCVEVGYGGGRRWTVGLPGRAGGRTVSGNGARPPTPSSSSPAPRAASSRPSPPTWPGTRAARSTFWTSPRARPGDADIAAVRQGPRRR